MANEPIAEQAVLTEDPNKSSFDRPTPPLDEKPKFESSHTFKLRTPVTLPNSSESFDTLVLRSPNGLDFLECDRPSYMVWIPKPDGKGAPDMRMMRDDISIRKWLTRLSGKPMTVFYAIPAGDLNAIIQWVTDEVASAGN